MLFQNYFQATTCPDGGEISWVRNTSQSAEIERINYRVKKFLKFDLEVK